MSDRFKYRCFIKQADGTYKQVEIFAVYFTSNHIEVGYIEGVNTHYPVVDGDTCILEQCTGLKDKNGKLIYEGDKVKINDETAVVVWDNRCFWYDFAPFNKGREYYRDRIEMGSISGEIIGNVHDEKEVAGCVC